MIEEVDLPEAGVSPENATEVRSPLRRILELVLASSDHACCQVCVVAQFTVYISEEHLM